MMRPVHRIVVVVENETLPHTLIYDIRTLIAKLMPDANIVIREGDNAAYYVVEGSYGKQVQEAYDEVRRQAAHSGGSEREASS